MPSDPDAGVRLARFLARAGIDSRRGCERLIEAGRVEVDGAVVRSPATRVEAGRSVVKVDGRLVRLPSATTYIAAHKPPGVVSTTSDPRGRPTVMDMLPDVPGLFPVGRLDMSSEGLILATDDGEWAHGILHPSAEIPRTYRVLVHGEVRGDELVQLEAGVALADGITSPARASVVSNGVDGTWLELVVHEGRNRQVRRMLASVGHEVLRLLRTAIGPVELGDLRAGSWRRLETGEVDALRRGDGGG